MAGSIPSKNTQKNFIFQHLKFEFCIEKIDLTSRLHIPAIRNEAGKSVQSVRDSLRFEHCQKGAFLVNIEKTKDT